MIDSIYNTKDRLPLHIVIANYTKKHVTFNKGQSIGYVEPFIDHIPQTSIKSLTTQKMNTFILTVYPLPYIPPKLCGKITQSIVEDI